MSIGHRAAARLARGLAGVRPRLTHLLVLTALALAVPIALRAYSVGEAIFLTLSVPDGDDAVADAGRELPPIEPAAGPEAAASTPERQPRSRQPIELAALTDLSVEISRRREILDRREQELALREAMLAAAEGRVREQLDELKRIERSASSLLGKLAEEDRARIIQLVKIYEAMKPQQAAVILNGLAIADLLPIVEGMREAKVSPIVAAMDPEKARELTLELARKREMAAAP